MKQSQNKYLFKNQTITCPCCLSPKSELKLISKFIDQLNALEFHPVSAVNDESFYFLKAKEYLGTENYIEIKWACDECLDRERAFLSNTINDQRSGLGAPIFAFFDLKSICAKCNSAFVFSKGEWKYWIDDLHFYYLTTKKYCETCQPIELLKKRLSKYYSTLQELTLNDEYVEIVLKIAAIYQELGAVAKRKDILKKSMNNFKKTNDLELINKLKVAYHQKDER